MFYWTRIRSLSIPFLPCLRTYDGSALSPLDASVASVWTSKFFNCKAVYGCLFDDCGGAVCLTHIPTGAILECTDFLSCVVTSSRESVISSIAIHPKATFTHCSIACLFCAIEGLCIPRRQTINTWKKPVSSWIQHHHLLFLFYLLQWHYQTFFFIIQLDSPNSSPYISSIRTQEHMQMMMQLPRSLQTHRFLVWFSIEAENHLCYSSE